MGDTKREVRKHLMIMVALVLAIDAIAIGLYMSLGIENAPRNTKTIFTAAWTLVTLAVVLNGLYRIRVARNRGSAVRR